MIVISKQHQPNVLIRYAAHRPAQILSFIFETKTPIIYYVPIQRKKNALSIGKYFVYTVIISIGTATSKPQPFFKMCIIRHFFYCYCYVLLHSLIFFLSSYLFFSYLLPSVFIRLSDFIIKTSFLIIRNMIKCDMNIQVWTCLLLCNKWSRMIKWSSHVQCQIPEIIQVDRMVGGTPSQDDSTNFRYVVAESVYRRCPICIHNRYNNNKKKNMLWNSKTLDQHNDFQNRILYQLNQNLGLIKKKQIHRALVE